MTSLTKHTNLVQSLPWERVRLATSHTTRAKEYMSACRKASKFLQLMVSAKTSGAMYLLVPWRVLGAISTSLLSLVIYIQIRVIACYKGIVYNTLHDDVTLNTSHGSKLALAFGNDKNKRSNNARLTTGEKMKPELINCGL